MGFLACRILPCLYAVKWSEGFPAQKKARVSGLVFNVCLRSLAARLAQPNPALWKNALLLRDVELAQPQWSCAYRCQ